MGIKVRMEPIDVNPTKHEPNKKKRTNVSVRSFKTNGLSGPTCPGRSSPNNTCLCHFGTEFL